MRGEEGDYWEEKGGPRHVDKQCIMCHRKVGRFKAMNVEQTHIPHSSDLENFVKRYTRRNQFFAYDRIKVTNVRLCNRPIIMDSLCQLQVTSGRSAAGTTL